MKQLYRLSALMLIALAYTRASAGIIAGQNTPPRLEITGMSFSQTAVHVTDGTVSGDTAVWYNNFSLLKLSNQEAPNTENDGTDTPGELSGWNWHRIFGFSTIVSMLTTIVTGFLAPTGVHYGFAGLTSVLGIITCANGYYQYHSVLGFTNGSVQYTMHAILGTAATAGFIATIALADSEGGKAHIHTGAASGVLFTVTLGILYF